MNNFKSHVLAVVGILCLVASLALQIVGAGNMKAPTVAASTAHFNPGRTYMFIKADGNRNECKVVQVDGAWLKCASLEWLNTNAMASAFDTK